MSVTLSKVRQLSAQAFALPVLAAMILLLPATAMAGSTNYQSTLPDQNVKIGKIVVTASDKVKAEKVKYDSSDVKVLSSSLTKKVRAQLQSAGVWADQGGDTLVLTLTKLTPNRPTMAQMRAKPSLSFQSYGLGGASLTGQLMAPDGKDLGNVSYSWEETWIENVRNVGTWYDANRAFSLFARHLARDLQGGETS